MVPELPLHLLGVAPAVEQHRRARVSERVEAHPRDAGLLRRRDERALAKVAVAVRDAAHRGEHEFFGARPFRLLVPRPEMVDERGGERYVTPAVSRLRRLKLPRTYARRTFTCGAPPPSSTWRHWTANTSEIRSLVAARNRKWSRLRGGVSSRHVASCSGVTAPASAEGAESPAEEEEQTPGASSRAQARGRRTRRSRRSSDSSLGTSRACSPRCARKVWTCRRGSRAGAVRPTSCD
jgi:hypothetical protein